MAINMRFEGGKPKVLTLSYDDGVVQDIRLINILNKYGIKATFNINSGLYTDENAVREKFYGRLKLSEAKELYINSGHEVALHTVTHPSIALSNRTEMLKEIFEDKRNIERDFGTIVRGMAYPNGSYSDEVVDALKASGIVYSRTTISNEGFGMPQDWLRLEATCHHNNPKLMELADRFINTFYLSCNCHMFYLWGHSYEFDNDDNWEVIEKFAEYMGGRDDIWYATNIEIYDYVQAFKNLQISANSDMIHNPSAIDVWVKADDKDICIKAGETVKL